MKIIRIAVRKAKKHPDKWGAIVPVVIPDDAEVIAFAKQVHAERKAQARPLKIGELVRQSNGLFQGWHWNYTPQHTPGPWGSSLKFWPASFVLGHSDFYWLNVEWEAGENSEPTFYGDEHFAVFNWRNRRNDEDQEETVNREDYVEGRLRGKYSHLEISSEDFCDQKQKDKENSHGTDRPDHDQLTSE